MALHGEGESVDELERGDHHLEALTRARRMGLIPSAGVHGTLAGVKFCGDLATAVIGILFQGMDRGGARLVRRGGARGT